MGIRGQVAVHANDFGADGGFVKRAVISGAGASVPLTVPGINGGQGDKVTAIIEWPAIAALVDRLGALTAIGVGTITLSADTTGNQLLVEWLDQRLW